MPRVPLIATFTLVALVAACASRSPDPQAAPAQAHYRCDHDVAFTVRFDDDSAQIDAGPLGTEALMRDAGGATAAQTVYSSTTMKVEFGLGPRGDEARLNYVSPPLEAHCVRD